MTPAADFTWQLKDTSNVLVPGVNPLETPFVAPNNDVVCNAPASADDYTLTPASCDTHDGRKVCVSADNEHSDAAAESCATIDVRGKFPMNPSYTTRILQIDEYSKLMILKIRESIARALFLYKCTLNTLCACERSVGCI